MVLQIARQSVVIKCNLRASIMTGNYEFYYASGLLYKLKGIAAEEIPGPEKLFEQVEELLEGFEPEDEREKHLVHMLRFYKPTDQFDGQMQELFTMGMTEQNMWHEL